MTNKIIVGSASPFLPFSISAKSEYDVVDKALKEIRSGDRSSCAVMGLFSQRHEALIKEYASFPKDHDFGARETLNKIDAALGEIYKTCRSNG